ncbi:MAG: hypothetical protein A3F47_02455 [Candidatus Staskawiczbacteria bacterium RIFCSPHIGHO2_12_FULL_38_11]|uniref:Uncharacterized protein n=1 Tax=Candidatus Staskawiczbacteria bacterium RIFCSPHIGHO2_12_FULL_38_11 TaxID=1802209 RepID=A0A1G2I457_9BACT|nr:MAG: hypothetical protein A3F47_02455 [Candidatus Staskawiczbacteria bacterium RIFCSPHIGHO2_12_FULL_38_11]
MKQRTKILTPKLAQKMQDQIYYAMPDEKKIQIVSQFFMLANALKNSKTVLKNESGRTAHKHQ